MRLDHLLSREEVGVGLLLICQGADHMSKESCDERMMIGKTSKISGGDALTGHTRSHPEHDG